MQSQNEAEKDEISGTSPEDAQYSIPNCIRILEKLRVDSYLRGEELGFAVELTRDSHSRVVIISSEDSPNLLLDWIYYMYRKNV